MATLDEWEFKACGSFNNNEVFLLGTRHLPRDIPIVKEVFDTLNPTMVLVEGTAELAEKQSLSEEVLYALNRGRQENLKIGFFDVDYALVLREIIKNVSLIDAFFVFILNQITVELISPNLEITRQLIEAIRIDRPDLHRFVEIWLSHMALVFAIYTTKKEEKQRSFVQRITSHQGYKTYLDYLKGNIGTIYYSLTATEEVSSFPGGNVKSVEDAEKEKTRYLSALSPNYERAQQIWIDGRSEKMWKKMLPYFKGGNERILIITGLFHFNYFKERLSLQ